MVRQASLGLLTVSLRQSSRTIARQSLRPLLDTRTLTSKMTTGNTLMSIITKRLQQRKMQMEIQLLTMNTTLNQLGQGKGRLYKYKSDLSTTLKRPLTTSHTARQSIGTEQGSDTRFTRATRTTILTRNHAKRSPEILKIFSKEGGRTCT
jgi:hypothetical protein